MIITAQLFETIKNNAFNYADRTKKHLRKGQAIYNYMYSAFGNFNPTITTFGKNEVDCFYNDAKVMDFIECLRQEIVDTNDYE